MAIKIDVMLDIKSVESQLKQIEQMGKKVTIKTDTRALDGLNKGINTTNSNLVQLGKNILSIPTKFAEWYIVSGIVTGFISSIKSAIDSVFRFNDELLAINFTMDLSEEQLQDLAMSSFDMAEAMKTSVHEVMTAQAVFSNLNEELDSLNEKTQTTISLANLTGSSVEQMAELIQSASFQFKDSGKSAQDFADIMVAISQDTGVSFQKQMLEISSGLSRVSTVAEENGFTFEQLTSTLATLGEQSRLSSTTLAAGLTTSLTRMRNTTGGSGEDISKLETALKKLDIQLRDANGEFRNSFTVLQELSKVYPTLTSVEKSEIGQLISANRQRRIFNALMENMGLISERAETSLSKTGETMRLNAIYAESLRGKSQDLTNSFEILAQSTFSEEFLGNMVDTGTNFVDTLIDIQNSVGLLNTALLLLLPTFIALKGEMIATKALNMIEFFRTLAIVNGQVTAVVGSEIIAFTNLNIAMGVVTIALGAFVALTVNAERKQREMTEAIKETSEELKNVSKSAVEADALILKFAELGRETNRTKAEEQEYIKVQEQLNGILPESKDLIDKKTMSLEEQLRVYQLLNNEARQNAIQNAQEAIAEFGNQYETATRLSEAYQIKIDELSKTIEAQTKIVASGEATNGIVIGNLRTNIKERDRLLEILEQQNAIIKIVDDSQKVLNRAQIEAVSIQERLRKEQKMINLELEEMARAVNKVATNIPEVLTEVQLLTRAFAEMSEQGKINGDTFALLIEKFPEIADNLSINQAKVEEYTNNFKNLTREQIFIQQELTNRVIEETIKRITAYQEELKSLEQLINSMSFVDGGFELEKQYIRTTLAIETQADRLRDLKSQSMALNEVSKSSSKTKQKELNLLTAEELALQDINNQIERQQSIRSLAEGDREKEIAEINKLIGLYIQQQARLHDLNEARREQLATGELNAEEQQKLQQEIAKTSNEWIKTSTSIRNLQDDIISINDAYDKKLLDTLKKINDELKEQIDLIEDEADKAYDKIKDSLDDQIDSLEKARDLALENAEINTESAEDELDAYQRKQDALEQENRLKEKSLALDKAKLKLANIQAEKNVRIFRADAGGFVFEADPRELRKAQEEIDKLQKDYNDQVVSDNKKAEEQKLKDTVDKLKEQERAIKKSYDKQIKDVKNILSELSDITSMELDKAGDAWSTFVEANSSKIKGFEDQISSLISRMQLLSSQSLGISTQIEQREGTTSKVSPSGQIEVRDTQTGRTGKIHIDTFNDPKFEGRFEALKTGGVIAKEGVAYVHANEPVLNPAQTANVASALGMQLGSAMDNARNLFSFANQPKVAMAGGMGGNSVTVQGDLVFPGVKTGNDARNVVDRLYQIGRTK